MDLKIKYICSNCQWKVETSSIPVKNPASSTNLNLLKKFLFFEKCPRCQAKVEQVIISDSS